MSETTSEKMKALDIFTVDKYDCSKLGDEARCIAKEYLREDDSSREQALSMMREWIQKHPAIVRCRLGPASPITPIPQIHSHVLHYACLCTDSSFLLRFLRKNKFNVPITQENLLKYLVMRQRYPQYMQRLNMDDPGIADLLRKGATFPLMERDQKGRRVFYFTSSHLDPEFHTASDTFRKNVMCMEAAMEEDEDQVRGFVLIIDQTGVSFRALSVVSLSEIQSMVPAMHRSAPGIVKQVHHVGLPAVFNSAFEAFRPLLPAKIRGRVILHSDIDTVKNYIPQRILPKEFGGVTPKVEMIAAWNEELRRKAARIQAMDQMKVDLNLLKGLNTCRAELDSELGVHGNFRKLQID